MLFLDCKTDNCEVVQLCYILKMIFKGLRLRHVLYCSMQTNFKKSKCVYSSFTIASVYLDLSRCKIFCPFKNIVYTLYCNMLRIVQKR